MLVLTIRPNGCLLVGDDIKIYNHQDFQIQVGIDAPKEIRILRGDAKKKKIHPPEHDQA